MKIIEGTKILVLSEADLNAHGLKKSFKRLDRTDFRVHHTEFEKADKVIYEQDGRIKILKDRAYESR